MARTDTCRAVEEAKSLCNLRKSQECDPQEEPRCSVWKHKKEGLRRTPHWQQPEAKSSS